ncbi:MAG: HD domain-containing protein [bacterium]|nr:HD domain-containing protein [bacterium]
MHIVNIDKVKSGDILGKSLFSGTGELLLASGFRLDDGALDAIRRAGYRHIYLMDGDSIEAIPQDVISEASRLGTISAVRNAFIEAQKALQEATSKAKSASDTGVNIAELKRSVDITALKQQVSDLIRDIIDQNSRVFNYIPVKSNIDYVYQHATDVALLALLLAQEFGYSVRDMYAIGISALLHDIGKAIFPVLLEKSDAQMTRDERMMYREHPTYSMLLLKKSSPQAYIEHATILQHHERVDGSGFPQGLKSKNIPPISANALDRKEKMMIRHAEILAVADEYDNLMNGHSKQSFFTPEQALSKMKSEAGRLWNSYVVKALTRIILLYPIGSIVVIRETSSKRFVGYRGVVYETNQIDQTRPIILLKWNSVGAPITPKVIDLAYENVVRLEMVLDVSDSLDN